MELAQADHAADVARQIAEGECHARRRDEAEAWLKERQDENAANADAEGFAPANNHLKPEPKPRKLKTRFVRRFGKMVRAKNIKCRIGEDVFVKDGDSFRLAGVVNKDNRLPLIYQEDTP